VLEPTQAGGIPILINTLGWNITMTVRQCQAVWAGVDRTVGGPNLGLLIPPLSLIKETVSSARLTDKKAWNRGGCAEGSANTGSEPTHTVLARLTLPCAGRVC